MEACETLDVKKTLKALARIKYSEKNVGILSVPEFIIVSNIIGPDPLFYGDYCMLRKRLPKIVSQHLTARLFSKVWHSSGKRIPHIYLTCHFSCRKPLIRLFPVTPWSDTYMM